MFGLVYRVHTRLINEKIADELVSSILTPNNIWAICSPLTFYMFTWTTESEITDEYFRYLMLHPILSDEEYEHLRYEYNQKIAEILGDKYAWKY